MTRYTLAECQAKLPEIQAYAEEYFELDAEWMEFYNSGTRMDQGHPLVLHNAMTELLNHLGELDLKVIHEPIGTIHIEAPIEGEDIVFCWQVGETEFSHWHRSEEDCAPCREMHQKFDWTQK